MHDNCKCPDRTGSFPFVVRVVPKSHPSTDTQQRRQASKKMRDRDVKNSYALKTVEQDGKARGF